ncbi:hypothetical protein [Paenarthrobacter nicotinovorans]|uniref:hypothetical protein n=1 Tax=Paenarthrobacter nicotinovorans TaxID=29320 RepID=UPI0011A24235|nr:hypothetical protein [Paenarthrobacter nicotinovorans]
MKRGWKIGCAGAVLLALSSCAGPGIEELGRSAIRDRAEEGMDWFTGFTSAGDASDRDAVRSRLQGTNIAYTYGWDPDGNFYADRYYREHLTTSGGLWAEQRTVSACVRYTEKPGGPVMESVACPDEPPFTERVDEQVTVP